MKNLSKLQQDFANHIYQKSDKKILDALPYKKEEALARLNVYRNNVLGNFESVLSSVFAVTKIILGEEKFDDRVQKFCHKNFSKSGNLDEYGRDFPQFLKSCKPLWVKDLARLELLLHESYFFAASEEEFDVKKFKKVAPEKFSELIFSLDSACILFSSKFAVCSILQKRKNIKLVEKPEFAVVLDYSITQLTAEEFVFLSEIQKGKKLYSIYQTLNKKFKKEVGKKEVDIGKLINRFISNGIIKKYA